MPKSPIHYVQTLGLDEDVSISLTTAKGLNGTVLAVGHTSPVFGSLPVLAREAVAVLRPVAPRAVGVTFLAVVGVFVAVETIGTHRDAGPLWGGREDSGETDWKTSREGRTVAVLPDKKRSVSHQ